MEPIEVSRGDYLVSTDPRKLDLRAVHAFLAHESYWARGIPYATFRTAVEHSLCYGLYHDGRQAGFARVVTDFATTAYVGDVFVLPPHRGKGLGKWLMDVVVAHPEMQGLRRWVLATADAHELYRKSGFSPLAKPERWMERHRPGAYD